MSEDLSLGIDTGGTYTDAVLHQAERGVVAKAKALTTPHDLAIGIREAADAALAAADPSSISLVSLSTTLATNALVEGRGGRVALIMIGFAPADLDRSGLRDALRDSPVVFLEGGHDVYGRETPLKLDPLAEEIDDLASSVTAFAVAGYFAVRNPAHELAVRDYLRAKTGLPVTCSHELSSRLGGPRRALTTLLNARLIALIDRLIEASEGYLREKSIAAPLMIVRGDGALIAAAEARLKPIETILSGPAASLVGAQHLTGLAQAVVADIGGTTTDVAVLEDGRPRLHADGAFIGGHRTMVEAVAMHTFGLGGDSEIRVELTGLETRLVLGPRRQVPLALAAKLYPAAVLPVLERQLRSERAGRHDGRFAWRAGLPERMHAGLPARERGMLDRLGTEPVPLEAVLTAAPRQSVLERLEERGLVVISAFTPSDAMHVLGQQAQWDASAARLGAMLLAQRRDGAGKPLAGTPEEFAEKVRAAMIRQSSLAVLEAAFAEDETWTGESAAGAAPRATSPEITRALARAPGIVRLALSLDRPLVGLGAAARIYYPQVAAALGAESVIPEHADVANAVGAVVGQVRCRADVTVTSPREDLFLVAGIGEPQAFPREEEAMAAARQAVENEARRRAEAAGAGAVSIRLLEEIDAPEAEGRPKFIEARLAATATGRPRLSSIFSTEA